MCGSTDRPAVAAIRSPDQPFLGVAALSRLVSSECHAIIGTIALNEGLVLRLPESIAAQRLAELVHALESRREP